MGDYIGYEHLPWIDAPIDPHSILIPLLPETPTILEAGCHDGADTIRFKQIWPNSTIIGFEPLPDKYSELQTKLARTNSSNVKVMQKALSDHSGTITFFRSTSVPGASSLFPDNYKNVTIPDSVTPDPVVKQKIKDDGYKDTQITVECTTGDEELNKLGNPKIDMIWFDLEGGELVALQNTKAAVESAKVIMIEVNFIPFRYGMCHFDEINKFLTDNGFTLKSLWGRSTWQADCLYVRG